MFLIKPMKNEHVTLDDKKPHETESSVPSREYYLEVNVYWLNTEFSASVTTFHLFSFKKFPKKFCIHAKAYNTPGSTIGLKYVHKSKK
jgi:hypothetical protein